MRVQRIEILAIPLAVASVSPVCEFRALFIDHADARTCFLRYATSIHSGGGRSTERAKLELSRSTAVICVPENER